MSYSQCSLVSEVMLHEQERTLYQPPCGRSSCRGVTFSKEGGFWAIELVEVWSPHVLWRTTMPLTPFGECW
jgi:hypothetical protein